MLPQKGAEVNWTSDRLAEDLKSLGYAKIIFGSDQEPAITSIHECLRVRGIQILPEESPIGDHERTAERTVQEIEDAVKVVKDSLEEMLDVQIPTDHPVMSWMVEYAADCLNKFQVGKDGKTAYERVRG